MWSWEKKKKKPKKKRKKKKLRIKVEAKVVLSLRMEPSLIKEIDELVAQYKTISRTEFIRMSVEFCMQNTGFLKNLETLD